MRQVPPFKYLIIGNGRAAKHFSYYLGLLQHQVLNWHSRQYLQQTHNNSEQPSISLQSLYNECDRALLLIKDSAIEPFINEYPFLRNQKTIHFSGSLIINGISNVHPLVSLGSNLFSESFYKKVHFARFDENKIYLNDLLPGLPNSCFYIPQESKSLYHGLCVASGNLTVLLWQLVSSEFHKIFSIENHHLIPYLESVFLNLSTDWEKALTGPIARRDETTLYKNYLALKNSPLKPIFMEHVRLAWPDFAEKYFTAILEESAATTAQLPIINSICEGKIKS